MTESLLPANSTTFERALSLSSARFNPARILPTIWNPFTCPAALLPWLAWALAVDEWDYGWPVEKKRAVVAAAIAVHENKGTPSAIRTSLAALDQPDADIIERADSIRRNGVTLRNGLHRRRGLSGWPTFRVVLHHPVTVDQAYQIKRLLAATKRNCVELLAIDFAQAALRRNGLYTRNGAYTRGTINTQIN